MSDDINKSIDYIYKSGLQFAEAKAQVTYLTEFLKSKRAILTKEAMAKGSKSVAAAEIEALSHPEYITLLEGLRDATKTAEGLRWGITAAQARIDVFRTTEASNRRMDRVAQ